MNTTTNLNLSKPLSSEKYSINIFNDNMDKIDEKLMKKEDLKTYEGVTLFESSEGETGEITLSQDVSNFKIVKIYFKDNMNCYNSVEVESPNNKNVNLTIAAIDDTNIHYTKNRQIKISGTKITNRAKLHESSLSVDAQGVYTLDTAIKITKIVGYKNDNFYVATNIPSTEDGKCYFVKLWENNSPRDAFPAQDINLSNLSNYKFLMILFYDWGYEQRGIQTIIAPCINGTAINLNCSIFANSRMHFGSRLGTINVTNNKLTFDINHGYVSDGTVNTDNGWNVPYQIYGMKIQIK